MAEEILVRVAEYRVAQGDAILATLGLGSCVAVALQDTGVAVGGLAHILLPSPSPGRPGPNPGRFPQTALPRLVEEMLVLGADRRRLVARLIGGASMFVNFTSSGAMPMGDRNVIAVREVLNQLAIPVVGEAVGGTKGRSVWCHVSDGRCMVRSVGEREQPL